jgi:hypothetical protein
MVQIKYLGIKNYEDTVILKERHIFQIEREKDEPIELSIIETADGNIFVDVHLREKDYHSSTYIAGKYFSVKANIGYKVITDTIRYYDGSVVCEYTKENVNKPRKLVLSEAKKEDKE